MKNRPIGIFDSGVGGLTVVKEIIRRIPNESIVYLGDTARVPYGTKSSETIKRFAVEDAEFLMKFNVKIIIVACHTASSISLSLLKKRFKVPIIGVIKAGAKKAVDITINRRIGVIGTPTTIQSNAYENEIMRICGDIRVVSKSCPLFVPLAEEGWLRGRITFDIAKKYLLSLTKRKIDTLVLGCTHYPLLKAVISQVVGKDVRIVDSAVSVTEEVYDVCERMDGLSITRKRPRHRFFATDGVEQFRKVGEKFLGMKIEDVKRIRYV